LRLVWNYVWERSIEGGVGVDSDGAEDLTLGTKVFLLAQEEWIPEASVILHVVTPTGARAFSNRNAEFEMNVLYGWDLPYDFTLGASSGYSTATQVEHLAAGPLPGDVEDRHNVFHQSVTVGAPWTDRLRSYLEYFGLYFDGLSGGRPEHYIDGGFTYLLNNDTQLDIRAGQVRRGFLRGRGFLGAKLALCFKNSLTPSLSGGILRWLLRSAFALARRHVSRRDSKRWRFDR
jgi:hypothetical protein